MYPTKGYAAQAKIHTRNFVGPSGTIYVGNGMMIHAPNPSAPVRIAPIDEMPFAGATRVV